MGKPFQLIYRLSIYKAFNFIHQFYNSIKSYVSYFSSFIINVYWLIHYIQVKTLSHNLSRVLILLESYCLFPVIKALAVSYFSSYLTWMFLFVCFQWYDSGLKAPADNLLFDLVTVTLLWKKHLKMKLKKILLSLFSLFCLVHSENDVLLYVQPEQIHLALGGKMKNLKSLQYATQFEAPNG